MEKFTVVVDSREKIPYDFDNYPVSVKNDKVDTGDYTIEGYEDYISVERKTKEDFLSSISQDRDRFEDEIRRARAFVAPMKIVVEEPWRSFKLNRGNSYDDTYSDIHPEAVKGTVNKWNNYYNIDFEFVECRPDGEEVTYDILNNFYETINLVEHNN